MLSRVAPAPVGSGVSVRALPPASFKRLAATCDHYLSKGGGYEGPASRYLFDLAHEVKALLEPLQREEAFKRERLRHLEEITASWNEIFGGQPGEKARTPHGMLRTLQAQQQAIDSLSAELQAARAAAEDTEQRCRQTVAAYHQQFQEELDRQARQHAAELERRGSFSPVEAELQAALQLRLRDDSRRMLASLRPLADAV